MNWLPVAVAVPLIAGIVCLVIPSRIRRIRETIAFLASGATVFMAGSLFGIRKTLPAWSREWLKVEDFSFPFALRMDTLSALGILATSVFGLLIVIYSFGFMRGRERTREYYAYLLLALAGAMTVLLADNLLVLLLGWELVTLVLFLLITIGGDKARDPAGKTFVMLGASDGALLLGIALVWRGIGTLSLSEIASFPIDTPFRYVMYSLLLIAALTKAGAMPFHTWLPTAAQGAPTSVMAYLPAALDKILGIYLLARISLFMFAISPPVQMALFIIGGTTLILAVMMAMVQHDYKQVLSFHAVSQVGYMIIGIATAIPVGVIGGLFHMFNNAVYKSCLFLTAGAVEKRTGTTELENLGGLARLMPYSFISCAVCSLAISGVPPFNGFVSKWFIYQGLVEVKQPFFLLVAMFGSALTLASFVKILHSVFLGKKPEALPDPKPAGFAMALPMLFLSALCLILGVVAALPFRYLAEAIGQTSTLGPAAALSFPTGYYSPTLATFLILIALAIGGLIYLLGRVMPIRTTTVFVGGEKLGTEATRYPGTGFYETIRNMGWLKTIYEDASSGVYDIYALGGYYGQKLVEVARSAHNGVLSTYVAFCVAGLAAILFLLFW